MSMYQQEKCLLIDVEDGDVPTIVTSCVSAAPSPVTTVKTSHNSSWKFLLTTVAAVAFIGTYAFSSGVDRTPAGVSANYVDGGIETMFALSAVPVRANLHGRMATPRTARKNTFAVSQPNRPQPFPSSSFYSYIRPVRSSNSFVMRSSEESSSREVSTEGTSTNTGEPKYALNDGEGGDAYGYPCCGESGEDGDESDEVTRASKDSSKDIVGDLPSDVERSVDEDDTPVHNSGNYTSIYMSYDTLTCTPICTSLTRDLLSWTTQKT
mgnify:CR=1 FL=1